MKNDGEFYTVRGYMELERDKKLLTPSMEDYLEMIYRNYLEDGYVRINTLAQRLNVQASSATKMVQKLKELNLLDYKKYGIISLTQKGKDIGRFLLKRHKTIETFLKTIGVEATILIDTEKIEHNISMETLEKIELLNSFFKYNPQVYNKLREFNKKQPDKRE